MTFLDSIKMGALLIRHQHSWLLVHSEILEDPDEKDGKSIRSCLLGLEAQIKYLVRRY